MPALIRNSQKGARKIALKKASGSQILSGLKITKTEKLHAERAVASAKMMMQGHASLQSEAPTKGAGLRLRKARLRRALERRGLKAIK